MKAKIKFNYDMIEEQRQALSEWLSSGEITPQFREAVIFSLMKLSELQDGELIKNVDCRLCENEDCSSCVHWDRLADCYRIGKDTIEVKAGSQ